ncbi:MAG: orotate phosphoribosyltransferase-like protein [Methanosarcinales archaeon Met12]|nr:MAG: orotate phosphoribosyltransferase-like protein [Methanosarcinales archaeon Met12]
MKNIDALIKKAIELKKMGLMSGEIADELNVSKETATWLFSCAEEKEGPAPKDIFIDLSKIGQSSQRMRHISSALTDMVLESIEAEVDVVVGIVLSGIPFATLVADELGAELAILHPKKQRWEPEKQGVKGTISHNFAQIEGKKCIIVDDVVTSGATAQEAVELLEEMGAEPLAIVVMMDKRGQDSVAGVPMLSLIKIGRVE